jgi:hypothetical protein
LLNNNIKLFRPEYFTYNMLISNLLMVKGKVIDKLRKAPKENNN